MHFALALLIAVNFWGARGVHVPCHPVAITGQDAMMAKDVYGLPSLAGADVSRCAIYISSQGVLERRAAPNWYCMDIVHEVGHLAGLDHTATGVMAATTEVEDIPFDCQHWETFMRRHRPSSPGSARGSASARASGNADQPGP